MEAGRGRQYSGSDGDGDEGGNDADEGSHDRRALEKEAPARFPPSLLALLYTQMRLCKVEPGI